MAGADQAPLPYTACSPSRFIRRSEVMEAGVFRKCPGMGGLPCTSPGLGFPTSLTQGGCCPHRGSLMCPRSWR